jgi:hypothetical protein
MYSISNNSLSVSILDPVADQERFGTRYCTGGYIFQVEDRARGPLMSGPNFPDGFVRYNGQGIPDTFNLSPLCEPAGGTRVLIVGIGLCDLQRDEVVEFCRWEVERSDTAIRMQTSQAFQGFALALERRVTLIHRTLRSATLLKNTGKAFIPVRWFPHPFYPQPATDELCRFNIPVRLAESEGFALADNGFVVRKAWPWKEGYFLPVDHQAQTGLVVLQKHPVLGLVAGTCSYIPGLLPVWGNHATFSWEPYLERTIGPGQVADWWVDYDF